VGVFAGRFKLPFCLKNSFFLIKSPSFPKNNLYLSVTMVLGEKTGFGKLAGSELQE